MSPAVATTWAEQLRDASHTSSASSSSWTTGAPSAIAASMDSTGSSTS